MVVILVGIVIFIFSGVVIVWFYMFSDVNVLCNFIFWLMGSLY